MKREYIRLHRDMLKDPIICEDAEHFATWGYLLLNASCTKGKYCIGGECATLDKGELLITARLISMHLSITEHKVNKILKEFEEAGKIEQVFYYRYRLIKITDKSFLDK